MDNGTSAEAAAKVALLRHLMARNGFTPRFIAPELSLDHWSIRADLVIDEGHAIHAYEIKTEADTLVRLERQIASYRQAFGRVTVVLATKHLVSGSSLIPSDVGIMELRRGRRGLSVHRHRAAKLNSTANSTAMSRLMPMTCLARLSAIKGASSRADAEERLRKLPLHLVAAQLGRFLEDRYGATTARFLSAGRSRTVSAEDVRSLHVWPSSREEGSQKLPEDPFIKWIQETGQTDIFGAVPHDIRELITS